jgi:predicted nucleic acid-binding protein
MILVDTSVWIDFFNGADTPHRHELHRLIEQEVDLALTGLVLTEVLQGFRHEKDFRAAQEHLLTFPRFDLNPPEDYLGAARLYRECRRKGITVRKPIDCLIAQVPLANGLTVFHRDSDFDRTRRCIR